MRNAEKPLPQFLLAHRFAAAPAHTGFDLLVGEHRLAGVAPVDIGFPADGKPFSYMRRKSHCSNGSIPVAGGHLPLPVVAEPSRFSCARMLSMLA